MPKKGSQEEYSLRYYLKNKEYLATYNTYWKAKKFIRKAHDEYMSELDPKLKEKKLARMQMLVQRQVARIEKMKKLSPSRDGKMSNYSIY